MQEQREFLSQLNQKSKRNFFMKFQNMKAEEDKNVFYSVILNKIIQLFQLFTEDHFNELQQYLKRQSNSRHSYNLVNNVIDLLEVYCHQKIKCQGFFNNTIQCLETLIEFVQGPCSANQKTLIEGKFLDVAQSILEIKPKRGAMKVGKSIHKEKDKIKTFGRTGKGGL